MALAAVLLLLACRLYHYVLQAVHVRLHLYLYILSLLSGTQVIHICLVTHHLEVDRSVTLCVVDTEVSVGIRRGAYRSREGAVGRLLYEVYLHKW